MAHYKRGKCRYLGRNRRSSETFRRKRLGLNPVRLPNVRDLGPTNYREWALWWQFYKRIFWPAGVWHWTRSYPRAWDIQQHTRPRRAREKQLARDIRDGRADPDNVAWPLQKKPHIYYW